MPKSKNRKIEKYKQTQRKLQLNIKTNIQMFSYSKNNVTASLLVVYFLLSLNQKTKQKQTKSELNKQARRTHKQQTNRFKKSCNKQ